MAQELIFQARHMHKAFGPTIALKDVDFELRRGEIRGLVGENGSGKSTIMSIASGMQPATSGEMLYLGLDADCAQLAPWNESILSADLIAELDEVKGKLASGEINVFAGPVYDNAGNEVLAEGAEFTNEELIGMMFLIDNVVGQLPS